MNEFPSFEQVLDAQNKSIQLQNQHWIKFELFTFQFWILIVILILPWVIWWKLVDKKRLLEIIIYGLIVSTFVTLLDEVGCQLNLWEYRYDIEPLFPRLIPMNFTMLPIAYMLIYQYFRKWKSFIIVNILAALFYAFIGESVFEFLDIYELLHWRNIYSFPIYIVLAIMSKIMLNAIMRAHKRF